MIGIWAAVALGRLQSPYYKRDRTLIRAESGSHDGIAFSRVEASAIAASKKEKVKSRRRKDIAKRKIAKKVVLSKKGAARNKCR
jgi:hypothetical protein